MHQQAQIIRRASEELTDSARQSLRMIADRTVTLQESNLKLTQNLFQNWIGQLQSQAEGNRQVTKKLQEQGERRQRAFHTLAEESANAYSDYLNSAMSIYRQTLKQASEVVQSNIKRGGRDAQRGWNYNGLVDTFSLMPPPPPST